MKHIIKSSELPWEPKYFPGESSQRGDFKALWKAHGMSQFEIRITRIPPGETNTKYHTHTLEEEWFYVLRGRCHICLNGDWKEIVEGDSVFKPVGDYHIFRNFSDDPCQIIMMGTNIEGSQSVVMPEPDKPELG